MSSEPPIQAAAAAIPSVRAVPAEEVPSCPEPFFGADPSAWPSSWVGWHAWPPSSPAGSASATHQDCRITASGPFFYAGMVFPSTVVECDTVKPRIRIEAALTMDGVEVDRSRRDCRKTDICHLEVDVSATDQPGNQVWCTFTTGWVQNHLVGHASSCESEEF